MSSSVESKWRGLGGLVEGSRVSGSSGGRESRGYSGLAEAGFGEGEGEGESEREEVLFVIMSIERRTSRDRFVERYGTTILAVQTAMGVLGLVWASWCWGGKKKGRNWRSLHQQRQASAGRARDF